MNRSVNFLYSQHDDCQPFKLIEILRTNSRINKKEFDEYYSGISHPDPVEHYAALDFSQLEDFKPDVELRKADSPFFVNFTIIQSRLFQNWEVVLTFIEKVVNVNLNKLSDSFRESKIYKTLFDSINSLTNISGEINLKEQNDRFTELIYLIQADINNLFIYYDEYMKIYKLIYNNIIKVKNTRNERADSYLIKLLTEFPANIRSEIDAVFPLNVFDLRQLNVTNDLLVFYPITELNKNLTLIRRNLEVKSNDGVALDNINIFFEVINEDTADNRYIILKIIYDSTDLWNEPPNNNGSLFDFKVELNKFGGDILDYGLDVTGFFFIHVKFLRYE